MELPLTSRLAVRQAILAVVVAIVLGVVFSAIQVGIDYVAERNAVEEEIKQVTRAFYEPSSHASFNYSEKLADQVVGGVFEFLPIYLASIQDENGYVIAGKERPLVNSRLRWLAEAMFGDLCHIRSELVHPSRKTNIGLLEIKMDPVVITQRFLLRSAVTFLSGFARNVMLAIALSFLFFYTLSRPLNRIIEHVVALDTDVLDPDSLRTVMTKKKDELNLLVVSIQGFLRRLMEYRQHKRDLADQVQSQADLLCMTEELTRTGSWSFNYDTGEGRFSQNQYQVLGIDVTASANFDTYLSRVHEDDRENIRLRFSLLVESGEASLRHEYRLQMDDRQIKNIVATVRVSRDNHTGTIKLIGADQDVTESRVIENALNRTQRLNAIGKMAGGLAHDFNNLLGIIIGNLDFLKSLMPDDDKRLKQVDASFRAAKRGEDLVNKLLSFSRNETQIRQPLGVNDLVLGLQELVERSVPQNINVRYVLGMDLWFTNIDGGDLGDALYNLVSNACDALPLGGDISVVTNNKVLGERYRQEHPDVIPGEYVEIKVSDNGEGISQLAQERMFEPFYTTKPAGKGTGLGLSMVYGFVQRSEGYINVKSVDRAGVEVLKARETGTTFYIYLPRCEAPTCVPVIEEQVGDLSGHGRILLIDDEDELLETAQAILEHAGYEVMTLADADRLSVILQCVDPFDLVISDIVMPGCMSGYDVHAAIKEHCSETQVMLTSGYDEDALAWAQQDGSDFLPKPYTQKDILTKVKKLIPSVDESS
ncbi:hypothetical protein A9Q99_03055 [Gammaproteobacteria bacterium 45_16_T64]|nr:hypothetical protein A9Q99_03055 [Gammaproteobacteria bacterium 45_16_T64]